VKTVGQRFAEWLAETLAEVHREPCHRCRATLGRDDCGWPDGNGKICTDCWEDATGETWHRMFLEKPKESDQ
jgi:hypothetical protein